MKKIISILCVLVIAISLTGCWKYGRGEMYGYVTAVDDGYIWSYTYVKTSLDSSDADNFIFSKNNEALRTSLVNFAKEKTYVKVSFYNHVTTATGNSNSCEIYKIEEAL